MKEHAWGIETHISLNMENTPKCGGQRPQENWLETLSPRGFLPRGAGCLVTGRSAQRVWFQPRSSSILGPPPWRLWNVEEAPHSPSTPAEAQGGLARPGTLLSPGQRGKSVSGIIGTCGFYIPTHGDASSQT